MELLRDPWNWFFAYLAIGLSFSTYTSVREWQRKHGKNAYKPPPVSLELKHSEDETETVVYAVSYIALTLFWFPVGSYFLLSDYWERFRAAKEKAWRESPAGKAELERQYRESIDREIAPWISPEDLTRRNVPWSDFDADYQEYQNLFQRDRDIFEALMAKIQPGDEIACFSTHEETWKRMFGRAGWAIVRDGKVIAQLVTVMN